MESILLGVMAILIIGTAGLVAWKVSRRKAAVARVRDEEDEFFELIARGKNQDTSYLKVI